MPCYNQWDAYLEPGSEKYKSKRKELNAKLEAVKHIVEFYYKSHGLFVPPASFRGIGVDMGRGHEDFECVEGVGPEEEIFEEITKHFACDEIHFTEIYDLVSLMNLKDETEAGFARVMLHCANKLRSGWGAMFR